jgi:hypothetical protein
VTSKLIKRRLVIALNDRAVVVPLVMDEISGGKAWIPVPAGRGALEDARELAARIKRGPLPGRLDFQVEDRIR